jgi:hypothetical protein
VVSHPVLFASYIFGALMVCGAFAYSTYKAVARQHRPSAIPLAAIWIAFFALPTVVSSTALLTGSMWMDHALYTIIHGALESLRSPKAARKNDDKKRTRRDVVRRRSATCVAKRGGRPTTLRLSCYGAHRGSCTS